MMQKANSTLLLPQTPPFLTGNACGAASPVFATLPRAAGLLLFAQANEVHLGLQGHEERAAVGHVQAEPQACWNTAVIGKPSEKSIRKRMDEPLPSRLEYQPGSARPRSAVAVCLGWRSRAALALISNQRITLRASERGRAPRRHREREETSRFLSLFQSGAVRASPDLSERTSQMCPIDWKLKERAIRELQLINTGRRI